MQTIHMKCQALFFSEKYIQKIKLLSAAVVIGSLRVKQEFSLQRIITRQNEQNHYYKSSYEILY